MNFKNNLVSEKNYMSTSWSKITEDDRVVLAAQNRSKKFDISTILAIARRCYYGKPQVVLCNPVIKGETPFPTIFWLTCPYLAKKCGMLESTQKIDSLEKILSTMPEEVQTWHNIYRNLRENIIFETTETNKKSNLSKLKAILHKKGVGGIDTRIAPNAAKCLHLQVATWLGMGKHPAEFWLKGQIGDLYCEEKSYCADFK